MNGTWLNLAKNLGPTTEKQRKQNFSGQSYLIANNVHPNWFPLFKKNQDLLCDIFLQLENVYYYPKTNNVFSVFDFL